MFFVVLLLIFSCVIFPSEKENNVVEMRPVSWKRDLKREQLGHISLRMNEAVCSGNNLVVLSRKQPLVIGTCILQLDQKTLGIKDPQVFEVLHKYNECRRTLDKTPYEALRNINSWQFQHDEVVLGWSRADALIKIQDPCHPDYCHKEDIENMLNQQRIALYEQLKSVNLYRQDHVDYQACQESSCFYDAYYALQRDIVTGTKSKDQLSEQFISLSRTISEQSVLIDSYVWSQMKQNVVSALSVYGIEKIKKGENSSSLLPTRRFFSEAENIAQKILFERLDRQTAQEELLKKEEEIHSLQCTPEVMQYAEKSLDCIRTLLENEKSI